jgi:RHS repeat-associated protein
VNQQPNNQPSESATSDPKGGGNLSGLGETFSADDYTGVAALSIPIYVSPARGFEPKLTLAYQSSSGNSNYGIGFSVNTASFSRRTEKGIPRYDGKDIFIFSQAGELIPKLIFANGTYSIDASTQTLNGTTYTVTLYVPRQQGSFDLIELWQDQNNASNEFWKVTNAIGTVSYYGNDSTSRIFDTQNTSHIFQWNIVSEEDIAGNKINYAWEAENPALIPPTIFNQGHNFSTQRYLSSIQYANYLNNSVEAFALQLVFDYGERNVSDVDLMQANANPFAPVNAPQYRLDPFSTYHAGFEIRTQRLCRNILMFHQFSELGTQPILVRRTSLVYTESELISSLQKIKITGCKPNSNGSYELLSMPDVDLFFSVPDLVQTPAFDILTSSNTPIVESLQQNGFLPVDLYGEGLPGLLMGNNATLLYLEPLGDGSFQAPATVAEFPNIKNQAQGLITVADLNSDGKKEIVVNSSSASGFFETLFRNLWKPFRLFQSRPSIQDFSALESVDLSGSGKADLVLIQQGQLQVYPSQGTAGYGPSKQVQTPTGFPPLLRGDQTAYVGFAPMLGDGLQHRVRIGNGSVECWPSLGYGLFGQKITLGNAPQWPENMTVNRVMLADIDGSGTSDLIFIYTNCLAIYFNQSGNSFANPVYIDLPTTYGATDAIAFADITGSGTTSVIFSSLAQTPTHYYYTFAAKVNLPSGAQIATHKPYLLSAISNNCGTLTEISYASSVKFYLQDKLNGTPWATRLPFPVQVVEQVTVTDALSANVVVTTKRYHEGYYDSTQREFRGFGYIESQDSESFALMRGRLLHALDASQFVAPCYTRTWYHTGAWQEKSIVSRQFEAQYFSGDAYAYPFPDSVFDTAIENGSASEQQQAFQALSGSLLRSEVYEGDGNFNPLGAPYTVAESNYFVKLYQAQAINPYASFFNYTQETINYNYDQNALDPSVAQNFTLQIDDFGHVVEQVTIHLPRRSNSITGATAYPQQQVIQAICQQASLINTTELFYLLGIPCLAATYQLYNLVPNVANGYFSLASVNTQTNACLAQVFDYSTFNPTTTALASRLLTSTRSYYWDNAQTNALPLGQVESLALHHHNAVAAFDANFPSVVYDSKLDAATISLGGYYLDSNYWWKNDFISYYLNTPGTFYQVWQTTSPFSCAQTDYDQPYCLHPTQTRQYLTTNEFNAQSFLTDYVSLKPMQQIDENNIVTQSWYNPIGRSVAGTLFKVVNNALEGGALIYPYQTFPATYQPRIQGSAGGPITLSDIVANPQYYLQGVISFNFDDPTAYSENQQPLYTINLLNENYASDPSNPPFACKTALIYSDGLGRTIENRIKAQPNSISNNPQWMVSGLTLYNNKGNPYKQYFPYFSDSYVYQTPATDTPVDPVPPTCFYYDAINRIVRKDTPKGFFSKAIYSPWQEMRYDEDDTVLDSVFYQTFKANYPANPTIAQQDQNDALNKAAVFYNTPTTLVNDNAGYIIRTIKTRNDATPQEQYRANDVTGREILTINALLLQENQANGSDYFSFAFAYTMDGDVASRTISADAGTNYVFGNIFDKLIWSFSANQNTVTLTYDNLQRQLTKTVLLNGSTAYLAEVIVYGETLSNAADLNLRGQVYQVKDQSGTVTNNAFSIDGQLTSVTRALCENYQEQPDWSNPVVLETVTYTALYTYNAMGQMVSEVYPDGSGVQRFYGIDGLLQTVTLLEAGGSTQQPIITSIQYMPNTQRAQVNFGNGVVNTFSYEATTQFLIGINTNRSSTSPSGQARNPVLQAITYTYDPVGNLTRMRDSSWETVFSNNQQVDALSDYTYDAFYRLLIANGRQHPSINYNTYINNSANGDVKQSKFFQYASGGNNGNLLENYSEAYTYDDADNLTEINHQAASVTWSRQITIAQSSNQIVSVNETGNPGTQYNQPYDAAGNQQQIYLNSGVALNWDYANRLISTGIIQRPTEPDDADYYSYNSGSERVRKVSERMQNGGAVTSVNETIYLGAYKIILVRNSATGPVVQDNRMLTIHDGESLVLVYKHNELASTAATLSGETVPDEFRFQLGNLIGSVAYELDENASILSYEEYYPYGGTSLIAGTSIAEVTGKIYRFSGKECDDSTGLYYFGARYYATWLCRWISCDPAGAVDGLNLYEYIGSNPLAATDLDGQGKQTGGKGKSKSAKKKPSDSIKLKKFSPKEQNRMKYLNQTISRKRILISHLESDDEGSILSALSSRSLTSRRIRITPIKIRVELALIRKEIDQHQVELDQFKAPPGDGNSLPSKVNNPSSIDTSQTEFFYQQMVISQANLNTDDRDSTNATMGKAYYGSGSISASEYSGRNDSGKGGLGEAWCHLIAHCLGGPEASNNLVAGSQGSNLVQLGIELAVRDFVRDTGNKVFIRVGADVYKNTDGSHTHIAQQFYYQIFDETGATKIFHATFAANILRAEDMQRDMKYKAYNAMATHFGTALKIAS